MSADFVMCTRNVEKGKFGNEPGTTRYLFVPEGTLPAPSHAKTRK